MNRLIARARAWLARRHWWAVCDICGYCRPERAYCPGCGSW